MARRAQTVFFPTAWSVCVTSRFPQSSILLPAGTPKDAPVSPATDLLLALSTHLQYLHLLSTFYWVNILDQHQVCHTGPQQTGIAGHLPPWRENHSAVDVLRMCLSGRSNFVLAETHQPFPIHRGPA